MRGFDYELWEFFGSSADNGWGAWCVESGWTNTWIGATMGLRTLKRGLLCRNSAPEYKKIFAEIHQQMSKLENNINSGGALMRNTAPGAE
jgi:hypothetical protein